MSPQIKISKNGDIEGEASEVIQYFKEVKQEKALQIPDWVMYVIVVLYIATLGGLFCLPVASIWIKVCVPLNLSSILIGCGTLYYKTKKLKGALVLGALAFLIFIYAKGQLTDQDLGHYGKRIIESQIERLERQTSES